MDLSLQMKTALVCGSSQGIGLAIATELALMGAQCLLLARNEKALQEAVASLDGSRGQIHHYFVADFSQPQQIKDAIQKITTLHRIHILVNNTGGPRAGAMLEADEQEFINAFSQHLVNNHILTKAVVPSMKKENYGRIINIISTSVRIPIKNLGVSNTIRGAVASWAKTMANELGSFNITVNNILPGYTDTQRLKSLIETNARKAKVGQEVMHHQMLEEVPLKRFGTPGEIAAVAAFLASPAAAYVSGTSIPVDGGKTGSI